MSDLDVMGVRSEMLDGVQILTPSDVTSAESLMDVLEQGGKAGEALQVVLMQQESLKDAPTLDALARRALAVGVPFRVALTDEELESSRKFVVQSQSKMQAALDRAESEGRTFSNFETLAWEL